MNFKYRVANIRFGILQHSDAQFAVCEEATANEMAVKFLEILPEDYSQMNFEEIRDIRMDSDPLSFWETIIGIFSVIDGEILRYLLHTKIPLKKLIRYELACRGYDKNNRWCGFEKAKEIWLNKN